MVGQPVTRITRAAIAVIWAYSYHSFLESTTSALIPQSQYFKTFQNLGANYGLPWDGDTVGGHWSEFWARYLARPEQLKYLSFDTAWQRIIPLRWLHNATLARLAGTRAQADVLLYPGAIVVIVRMDATGNWTLPELPDALRRLRHAKDWTLTTPTSHTANRNLDGIASDLRDEAAQLVAADDNAESDSQLEFSVVSPIEGVGDARDLNVENDLTKSCIAGLAVLGPPGVLAQENLLEVNSNTNHAARVYNLSQGHVIWHAAKILAPVPRKPDSLECLHRNQTDLIAHIAALSGIVAWAGDRLAAGLGIPGPTQPLVRSAVGRLKILQLGDPAKTYRSGIARERIKPLLATLSKVEAAVGPIV